MKNIEEKNQSLKKWLPVLLFTVITLVYSIRFFEPGKKIFGHDLVLISEYFDSFSQDSFKKGSLPFWNPYTMGGLTCLSISDTFYPVRLIPFVLGIPPHMIYLIEYIVSLFFAGFFMYLFLKILGLSEISSFIAGVFFMFCGDLATLINAGHTINIAAISLIPLTFYFVEKGIQKNKLLFFIFTGCVFGLQSLSFGIQIMVYNIVLLGIYVLFRIISEKKSWKLLLYFSLAVILVPLFSAIQFLPAFYSMKYSYRADPTYEYFTSWSYPPEETIGFLLPEVFGLMESTYWGYLPFRITSEYFGILPIVLALIPVFFLIKDKKVLFFTILSFITFFLSFGGRTPLYKILYHFPVISSFRNPGRWIYFFTFYMILLAGFGIDFIQNFAAKKYKPEDFKRINLFKITLIVLALILIILWAIFSLNSANIISSMQNWGLIKKRFAYQNLKYIVPVLYKMISGDMLKLAIVFTSSVVLILSAIYSKINKYMLAAFLIILYLSDIIPLLNKCVKTVPVVEMDAQREEIVGFLKEDKTLYRVLPLGSLYNKNWFTAEKIQSVDGYTLALKNYYDAKGEGLLQNIGFLSLFNVKYILSEFPIDNQFFRLVYEGRTKIYENTMNFPRAFLYSKVKVIKDSGEIREGFRKNAFNISDTLILNEDFTGSLDDIKYKGDEARITKFEPNYLNIEVNSSGDALLFLSEVYYPEWEAFIDGKETKVYSAFGLFRAVYLPKGFHKVEFKYSPKIFYTGLFITLATIAIIGFYILTREKTEKEIK